MLIRKKPGVMWTPPAFKMSRGGLLAETVETHTRAGKTLFSAVEAPSKTREAEIGAVEDQLSSGN
jgi:hypothetical protein